MRKLFAVTILPLLLLAACAPKQVHKDWQAVSGSKADAIVRLAYSWNPTHEDAITSQEQAISLASEKCRTWGYEGATAFGGAIVQCMEYGQYGCISYTKSVEFQCTGGMTVKIEPAGRVVR